MSKINEYINETKIELKQVSWPSRHQTMLFTVLVVVVSIATAYFLGFFDSVFTKMLEKIIN